MNNGKISSQVELERDLLKEHSGSEKMTSTSTVLDELEQIAKAKWERQHQRTMCLLEQCDAKKAGIVGKTS